MKKLITIMVVLLVLGSVGVFGVGVFGANGARIDESNYKTAIESVEKKVGEDVWVNGGEIGGLADYDYIVIDGELYAAKTSGNHNKYFQKFDTSGRSWDGKVTTIEPTGTGYKEKNNNGQVTKEVNSETGVTTTYSGYSDKDDKTPTKAKQTTTYGTGDDKVTMTVVVDLDKNGNAIGALNDLNTYSKDVDVTVSYTDEFGRDVEVDIDGKEWAEVADGLKSNRGQFAQAIAGAGKTDFSVAEGGVVTVGGFKITTEGSNVIAYDSNTKTTYDSDGGKRTVDGAGVAVNEGTVTVSGDFTDTTYDSKGQVTNIVTGKDGTTTQQSWTETNGKNTLTISSKSGIKYDNAGDYSGLTKGSSYNYDTFSGVTYYTVGTSGSDTIYWDSTSGKYLYFEDKNGVQQPKTASDAQVADALKGTANKWKNAEDVDGELTGAEDGKSDAEGGLSIRDKNIQSWSAKAEWTLTEFSGFSGFSTLLFGEETVDEWKQQVNDLFCSTILLGGTDCWVSTICQSYTPRTGDEDLLITTPSGLIMPIAHVEGERTEQLTYVNDSGKYGEYLYKFTYVIENPEDSGYEEIQFNIYIEEDDGDQTWIYEDKQIIEEGDVFERKGASAVVQFSNKEYTKICVRFGTAMYDAEGDSVDEICNSVGEVGEKAYYYEAIEEEVESDGDEDDSSTTTDSTEVDF